jgi:hypothetical protein
MITTTVVCTSAIADTWGHYTVGYLKAFQVALKHPDRAGSSNMQVRRLIHLEHQAWLAVQVAARYANKALDA